MKKKNLIFLIILIVLLLGVLTLYKLLLKNDSKTDTFKTTIVRENKKEDVISENKDSEIYATDIITNVVKKYDYELIINDKGIKGNIFIGTDSNIYIKDNKSNTNKLSEIPFKTLYKTDNFNGLLNLYALSNDGKLYYIFLGDLDIKKTEIIEIPTNFKINSFTNIKVKDPYSFLITTIVVLSENGNMYEPRTGIRYTDKLVAFNGQYFIFEDKTIANFYGNLLKDGETNYKIKYFLTFLDDESPFKDTSSFIITEDNKIIYCIENSDNLKIYNKKIKNIEYKIDEKNDNFVNIKLTFEDNSKMSLIAMYTDYYGFK